MNYIFLLAIVLLVVFIWHNFSTARECAIFECRKFCNEMNYQLLDETVALISFKPERDTNNNITIRRQYCYEFSIDGYQRYRGSIELSGNRIKSINLDHPDGMIIYSPEKQKETIH